MRPMSSFAGLVFLVASIPAFGQELRFAADAASSPAELAEAIADLASQSLARPRHSPGDAGLAARFHAELATGRFADAERSYASWRRARPVPRFDRDDMLALYGRARSLASAGMPLDTAFREVLTRLLVPLDDRAALDVEYRLRSPPARYRGELEQLLAGRAGRSTIDPSGADAVIGAYLAMQAAESLAPLLDAAFAPDDARRYVLQDDVLIKSPKGVTLSAVVARKRGVANPVPAILRFTIYADLANARYQAKLAAARGYAGVSADARGKRLSPDRIEPWRHEVEDTYAVIDWISRQPWCDGQVGMHGSSYEGFAQWAAAKSLHPALKTIIPAVASTPGFGLPMQNNVFQYANYAWPFYVMNNRMLDEATYYDHERWNALPEKWFASGRPWREIDAIDGTRNELLQQHMQHPSYDAYWQAMQPYREEYARITIPVLTLTGYFDDASAGAVNYVVEHYRYNPRAEHYLVIGPYDHVSTKQAVKPAVVRGHEIDPAAQLDSVELMFLWFDHVLRGAPRPPLLKDRISFEVMGANAWRHAPSIEGMSERSLKFYLTNAKSGDWWRLSVEKPAKPGYLVQTVDFADRTTQDSLYPGQAVVDAVPETRGFVFASEPLEKPVSVNGLIRGRLRATINKRDFDFALAIYEQMPDGRLFNLTHYLGRASYAEDMSVRRLLTPGQAVELPFERTPPTSRQLAKGSRLLVLLTVNKSAWAQVNHGTGGDVSDESIEDATDALEVRWHNDSYVVVPVTG